MGVAHWREGLFLHNTVYIVSTYCVCIVYISACKYTFSHPDIEDEIDYNVPKGSPASLKRSIPPANTSSTTTTNQKVTSYICNKLLCYTFMLFQPSRAVTLKLNVAETDLVVVEDPSSLNSNAVILKVEKFGM